MALKQDGVDFVLCPKQDNKIEGVVLNTVCTLGFFCPKQGQGFKPSAAHLYPNIGRVPLPPGIFVFTKEVPQYQWKNQDSYRLLSIV